MAKDTMSFLAEFFGKHICKWLPRSPELSPSDFLLWSYLKNIVHKDAPRTIVELKKKKWGHNLGNQYHYVSDDICKLTEKGFFMSGE